MRPGSGKERGAPRQGALRFPRAALGSTRWGRRSSGDRSRAVRGDRPGARRLDVRSEHRLLSLRAEWSRAVPVARRMDAPGEGPRHAWFQGEAADEAAPADRSGRRGLSSARRERSMHRVRRPAVRLPDLLLREGVGSGAAPAARAAGGDRTTACQLCGGAGPARGRATTPVPLARFT